MHKQQYIRSIASGFLFALFAVAITPRIVLHDMAARHTDSLVHVRDAGKAQLNKAVFQCNIDNLVAESPFAAQVFHFDATLALRFPEAQDHFTPVFLSSENFFHRLRGPPEVA